MDQNRRNIIVKEIHYWKQNHMLPEQYCNYLLALYTEGKGTEPGVTKQSPNNDLYPSLFLFLLFSISICVIYFTELSFILQMGVLLGLCFLGTGFVYYFFRLGITSHLSIILTAIALLLGSVEAVSHITAFQPFALYTVTFINCLLWIGTGRKLELMYLILSGLAGILLLFISFFIS
jgi:hypothetical protein